MMDSWRARAIRRNDETPDRRGFRVVQRLVARGRLARCIPRFRWGPVFGSTLLERIAGPPPADGPRILAWVTAHRGLLALTNEILFFATICLVPAIAGLYAPLAGARRDSAVVGCGIFATAIPLLAVMLTVHGRLVYPVFHISGHTPDVAELVVAIFYGGKHVVALLFAVASVVLSLALRHEAHGRVTAFVGFVTAACDVILTSRGGQAAREGISDAPAAAPGCVGAAPANRRTAP
jgi:hypothetical protein